jgi:hypothetical protein
MANEIFKVDEPAIEIITKGSTIDEDGKNRWQINTWVIRLNHILHNEYLFSGPVDMYRWQYCYETKEEAEAVDSEHKARRTAVEDKVKELIGITEGSYVLTKNLSEIFTVVNIVTLEREDDQ